MAGDISSLPVWRPPSRQTCRQQSRDMVKTTSVESGSIETPGEKIWMFASSFLQLEIGAHPVSGPPSRESDVIQSRDTVGTTSVVAGVLENPRKTAGMSNLSPPTEIYVYFRFGRCKSGFAVDEMTSAVT